MIVGGEELSQYAMSQTEYSNPAQYSLQVIMCQLLITLSPDSRLHLWRYAGERTT